MDGSIVFSNAMSIRRHSICKVLHMENVRRSSKIDNWLVFDILSGKV